MKATASTATLYSVFGKKPIQESSGFLKSGKIGLMIYLIFMDAVRSLLLTFIENHINENSCSYKTSP